jgi:predicted transcriptional regulator
MSSGIIHTLITSRTRVKLIHKFFLNPDTSSYLRNLEAEFGESTNSIRVELNRLEEAGLLMSFSVGNRKYYKANRDHPVFDDLQNMIWKERSLDKLIEKAKTEIKGIRAIILTGDLAAGRDSDLIDLIFVGNIDRAELSNWIARTEKWIERKLRYLHYSKKEWEENTSEDDFLLLWEK